MIKKLIQKDQHRAEVLPNMQYFERGKKEFVKRLTHTCICVMMHRYSCSKLQLHWYVCIASALVYPLLLPIAQYSPSSAQTADMQPMWTCNCFARAIQSALLHSVYFWLLGCLQLLPVHTIEWVNTVERLWATFNNASGPHWQHCICLCLPSVTARSSVQPMWTCNCFAHAIQSGLLNNVYFWLLGCLQLLPVHTRVGYKEWVNTVKGFEEIPMRATCIAECGSHCQHYICHSLPSVAAHSPLQPNPSCPNSRHAADVDL